MIHSETLLRVPLGIDRADSGHVDHIAYAVTALQHVCGFGKTF